MSDLLIERVDGDASLRDWRSVHNTVVPTAPLSFAQVSERAGRNVLSLARLDGVLVGCSTVRPPGADTRVATVIARILPAFRRRGLGALLYAHGLELARELGAEVIETCVLESNPDGLRFALRHGFVETDRYVLPGDTVPFIDLRLGEPSGGDV
ncbi:GNAT family N-acetyltransferase [Streptomyces sp. OfavH-34-F]|uniref:GNAT family N-acetyltransferase n=1 Tax=Streptomyces sp. OfavH-34-F TaxID=2917760 RepID=UPI001EF36915|nr:GNAT family N-acetyltransferase [Streptomyces sp. OfavH-34-F]MCG7526341.1 GNAT family N-acetyltransferase [Streptomyces sp. OfavH-34-F]